MIDTLTQTFLRAGIAPLSRHTAAKILAVCLIFGDEPFVFNNTLHAVTLAAAEQLHVRPMEAPAAEDAALIRRYTEELVNGKEWPPWIQELKQYGFYAPERKPDGIRIP